MRLDPRCQSRIEDFPAGYDTPYHYQCTDCGNEFTSYKDPKRVSCNECVSREIGPVAQG